MTNSRAKRVSARVATITVAAGLLLALGAGQAEANHVSCGDTITADTTLDSDLVNCPNNGVVIGADDITLDLNGHRVTGDGEPSKSCCNTGVVNDGRDGVTVRNGSVRDFDVGVFLGRARQNRVVGVSSSKNVLFGFLVAESTRSLIRGSSGSNNLAPEGDGLGMFSSHHIRIVDNAFRHNPGPGIHVGDSNDNLIRGNRFSRNAPGILIEGDRNRVRGNRCVRNLGCVVMANGNRNVIARNRVSGGDSGIGLEKGQGNLVARNVVVDTRRNGIYLGLNRPLLGGGHNVIRRNRVSAIGGDAFAVREKDGHSRLSRNVAIGAGNDGFEVRSRSAKLTGNRARRNANLGIDAARGVTDGGGNQASGNGNPLQCTNVLCA